LIVWLFILLQNALIKNISFLITSKKVLTIIFERTREEFNILKLNFILNLFSIIDLRIKGSMSSWVGFKVTRYWWV
jgi:hypothetical protein